MTLEEVRELFPHIKNGKIYFNHAATGPFSKNVLSIVNEYLKQRSETDIDNYSELSKVIVETKHHLGRMINCAENRIAFIDNTSNGMNILAQGIKAVAIEDLIFIYEKDNSPIGVSISLPDINEVIDEYDRNIGMQGKKKYIPSKSFFGLKDLNRDLKIFNIINRRLREKKFEGLRILILGIKEEYRKTGIDSQLYIETFKRAKELGIKKGSGSQLADINFDILNPLFKIGKLSMTWRVYNLNI